MADALRTSGLDPKYLELELTESILIDGTGTSAIDTLIDQSFVHDITTDEDDAAIVNAIIVLAKSIRLTVIAEGVETEAQMDFLKLHGCDQYQGYLLAKPVPPNEFFDYMRLRFDKSTRAY